MRAFSARKLPARKNSFPLPHQSDHPRQPCRQKDISFFFSEIDVLSVRPVPTRGAFRDRHGRWARDAMACPGWRARFAGGRPARPGRRSRMVLTPRRWRQVAGVMIPAATVANKPGTPGRLRISRKPVAQGGPVAVRTCGSAACFLLHADHGCDQHPAFPAPSCLKGAELTAELGRIRRREKARACARGCELPSSGRHRPRRRAIQYAAASR
jgi:hypothetical protein